MEEHVKLIKLYQETIPSGIPNAADRNKTTTAEIQILDHVRILRGAAIKVIEEAAKIKTET